MVAAQQLSGMLARPFIGRCGMATGWDPVDMEKAAFHEAGHTVVAWSLSLIVHHVELDVTGNSGRARIDDAKDVTHQVAVRYAGFEAEDMFKGPAVFVRAEEDFLWANEELTKKLREEFGQRKMVQSPEGRRLQVTCRALAQKWLRKHKDKVKRLSEALLLPPHKITREQFEQMMEEKG
jgi:ATP-dependent Zn protease